MHNICMKLFWRDYVYALWECRIHSSLTNSTRILSSTQSLSSSLCSHLSSSSSMGHRHFFFFRLGPPNCWGFKTTDYLQGRQPHAQLPTWGVRVSLSGTLLKIWHGWPYQQQGCHPHSYVHNCRSLLCNTQLFSS